MLKRIFKTICVLSIVIAFTISTNAAVSVSDGSAFVTKSEALSNLNDLSNRMASLENSLDAKIDSLVSSYLTRNGIWNGSKQTLTSNQCYAYYTLTQRAGYLRSWQVTTSGVQAQTYYINTVQYKVPNTAYTTSRSVFTDSLTKSGLLYCRFDCLPWVSDLIRIIPQVTNDGTAAYMQNMSGNYQDWMEITDQNNVVKYREDCKFGLVIGGNYYLKTSYDKIIFFFVSKDDKLYFQTGVTMSFGSLLVTDDGTSQFGHQWIFKDIQIY